MKEGQKTIAEIHAIRQCAVQKAIEINLHEQLPQSDERFSGLKYAKIPERSVNIGVAWLYGSNNLAQISESYGNSPSNASYHAGKFLAKMWLRMKRVDPIGDLLVDISEEKFFNNGSLQKPSVRKGRRAASWKNEMGVQFEREVEQEVVWDNETVREFMNIHRSAIKQRIK